MGYVCGRIDGRDRRSLNDCPSGIGDNTLDVSGSSSLCVSRQSQQQDRDTKG
jgi:hypothetical protein